jgi:hypothetical protein
MNRALAIKKVKAFAANPNIIKEPSIGEMADLVVLVLGAVDQIEKAIKEGRLDGKTPQPDKDYLSLETAQRVLNEQVREMVNRADKTLSQTSSELQARVQQSLENIPAGGSVTVETPTGNVNASNASFNVTSVPKWVVADGITYYENAGYTRSSLTITMDLPPSQYIRAIT